MIITFTLKVENKVHLFDFVVTLYMSRNWRATIPGYFVTHGTGPLACLSLFPVADLDKVS